MKLISVVLLALGYLCISDVAQAATVYRWEFVTKVEGGEVVQGATIQLVVIDVVSGEQVDLNCVTDEHGRCEVAASISQQFLTGSSSVVGKSLQFTKEGYANEFKTIARQTGSTSREITLFVTRKIPVRYTLIDDMGRAVEGASVWLSEQGGKDTKICTADASGVCAVDLENNAFSVIATADGYYATNVPSTAGEHVVKMARRLTNSRLLQAAEATAIRCKIKSACDRLYASATLFLLRNADMKTQVTNDTLTETFNPTKPEEIGGRVTRAPVGGGGWEVALELYCGNAREGVKPGLAYAAQADLQERECVDRRLQLFSQFVPWVTSHAN